MLMWRPYVLKHYLKMKKNHPMKTTPFTLARLLLASGLILAASNSLACSSCGCTLSSDWDSQGYAATPGLRFDLRYDYLDQAQLRSGAGKVARSSLELPNEREVEQDTRNQYTTLGFDYSASQDWGVNLQLPYIERSHSSIAPGDTTPSSSKTGNLGDVRILARYQGWSDKLGLQFGLKLPTGSFHDSFSAGPQRGMPLDRGLQAGSGTTDLLLGLYHFDALSQNWDYFAQGLLQQPLAARDGYQPGTSLNLNAGLRYLASESVIPQLQLNAKTSSRDRGANADSDNSGGSVLYLSPGVTISVNRKIKLFGFLQAPLYQNVNGLQLAPRYTFSMGVRYAL